VRCRGILGTTPGPGIKPSIQSVRFARPVRGGPR
jgi:hypothetical protein